MKNDEEREELSALSKKDRRERKAGKKGKKTKQQRAHAHTFTPPASGEGDQKNKCYSRGPRELFISGGISQPIGYRGLSGLITMAPTDMWLYDTEEDNHQLLEKLGVDEGLAEILPDRILSPHLFVCGGLLWCGGHCTGSLVIRTLCVGCAERQKVLPKEQLDKIIAYAEGERKEAELLVKVVEYVQIFSQHIFIC